jgi:N-acetylmuramoyl-L-alanine amidase
LRLTVRTRPRAAGRAPAPLAGLRVMIDAGHGGDDRGALGPSGLTEADVNLVVSALLGDRLEALGAEVRQLRSGRQHDRWTIG